MRCLAFGVLCCVVASAQEPKSFEQWEADVAAAINAPIEDPPEGMQYTAAAEQKVALLEIANDMTACPELEPVPEPIVQVFSEKPKQNSATTPLIINVMDQPPDAIGEIFVAIRKAETHEIPGIDLSLYPGLVELGRWVDNDTVALVVYQWHTGDVVLPATVDFEINRSGTSKGLEACAVTRLSNMPDWTMLQQDMGRDDKFTIGPSEAIYSQRIAVAVDGEIANVPPGWTVTAELPLIYEHPSDGPQPVLYLLIMESNTAGLADATTLDLTRFGVSRERDYLAIEANR